MAALGGCLLHDLGSAAADDGIALGRVDVRLAVTRSDDPPAIATLRADIALDMPARLRDERDAPVARPEGATT
jgi:uncharacterized OsmC-like protein